MVLKFEGAGLAGEKVSVTVRVVKSTTDQCTDKKTCLFVCRGDECVYEGGWKGERAVYYGRMCQNMPLPRAGWK